jgi:hypothetical protein
MWHWITLMELINHGAHIGKEYMTISMPIRSSISIAPKVHVPLVWYSTWCECVCLLSFLDWWQGLTTLFPFIQLFKASHTWLFSPYTIVEIICIYLIKPEITTIENSWRFMRESKFVGAGYYVCFGGSPSREATKTGII